MRRAMVLILLSASLLAAPSSPLEQIWSFLASVWGAPETVQPESTPDEGCGLDPDGKPACQHGS